MSIKDRDEAVDLASSPLEGEPNRVAPPHEGLAKLKARFGGGYNTRNTANAQRLRKEMTPWEYRLWLRINRKQLGGYKFRRQQPIGPYIVDFVNTEKRVILELDGSQHVDCTHDANRDAYLMGQGYSVLRFWNTDVNANLEGVLTAVLGVLETPPHQTTSHCGVVARINFSAWEVVWLPLEGGARCGAGVPYASLGVTVGGNT